MTTTVEDYDALLRELENCRIKNQTLIKHNDELKLISETTMHENILLKSQLVPELSPYHFGHDLLTSLNLPFCNTKCCIVMLDSSGARQCKNNRQATGLLCTTHASSPKHVAEKVNKAYATRCFERQAKVISASQTQSDCVTAYTSACDDNNNTELRGHVTVPASITSIGRFSSYGPSVFHAGAAFSNAPTTFGDNIACSSIIDARGGIAVSGFLSNAAMTLTDSGGGMALLAAPLHSTQDVHLQKELKVHGNATFDTHVSVNGTLYTKNLHPSFNTFQASNILISPGGIIQFGEGGSSTISFSNAPDTGLFNPVARTLGVVAGGTEMVRVSDTTVSLLGDLVVSSNIVPMTNATQYIGTSTMHFKEAWIDELHISSNTLYIGDTPVLCADNDAVSIRADPGQGITLTTTGDGETSLVSAKGVNVVSEGGVTMRVSGPLGRVNIQSSGAGGTVNLGAGKEIVMTSPLTTISSNMIVKGDMTVEGTQLTLNTQTVTIEDNIIVLNSGNIHNGEQNMRCFVDTAGNCIVKCFSATCDNHAPACIGRLVEPAGDSWDAGALHVNSKYIDIDACLEMKQAVDVWLDPERKDVNTLSVRSPMGSGKSTMLDALLERVGEDKTVLVVTYRQSLALEHKRKLVRRGFVSYLDADVTPQDLRQRDKTPRVICQIESLHKLAKHTCMRYLTSGFDIVVLDEAESLLRHFMSPTVVNPLSEIQGLADTLNATTTGVVTMDATWGSVTKDFLKQAGLRNLLVINDYRSTENARTFAISKDEATWSAQIRDDIIAGRNVVVVSLSQERAMQVHKAALDTFDDPKDAARLCLLHTSKTADAVKAMLIDVDALWSSKRVVVYTPTISAGVDFSTEHFDRMYLYLCPGSAAPMGALQMTGRVRHLVDTDVRTLVAKNMRVAREATRQHLTHVDLYQWLRWMEGFSTCLDVKHIPAIDGGDDHTLQELSDGVLAPLFATVAPPTLKMTVESYFLAEIYNASFDYVSCFADLLEHAGHRMDLGTSYAAVSAARVHAPPEGDMEATSEFLMRVLKAQEQLDALTGVVHAPVLALAPDAVPVPAPAPDTVSGTDIPTAMRRKDLMDAIEQRVMANDASEDDKFIMYLSRYCSAWGIDRVDEEFLMENKPGAVGSPKARLLSRLLCPILRPVRGADVHTTEHSGHLVDVASPVAYVFEPDDDEPSSV
eukprot:gene5449-biopygen4655